MFNENTSFYNDYFTHKGPILVFYIDILQNFFGNSWKSSIWILFLITFIFLSCSAYVAYQYSKNYLTVFLITIYVIFYFRYQTSDIFVDLINLPFILFSFLYFLKGLKNNSKINNFYLSAIFLFVSLLTRIDTLLYFLSLFLIFITYSLQEQKKYLLKINFYLKIMLIFFFIFLFFSILYNFNLYEFLEKNIFFNMIYAEDDYSKFKNLGSLYALIPYKLYSYVLIIKALFYWNNKIKLSKNFKYILIAITIIQIIYFLQKIENLFLFNFIFI